MNHNELHFAATEAYVKEPGVGVMWRLYLLVLQALPLGLPLLCTAEGQGFALLVQVARGQQVQPEDTTNTPGQGGRSNNRHTGTNTQLKRSK